MLTPQKRLISNNRWNLKTRNIKIEQAISDRGGKCERCGICDIRVLIWHHKDPTTKVASVRNLANSSILFWKEINKCILLCANCHMITHYEENKDEEKTTR